VAWKIAVRFERGGVSFQYPENWQILPEPYDLGWSVTVQSPGTAFLTLTCDESNPGIGELADAALSAIKDEFKQLDVSPFSGTVAGLPAIGHDVEFFSFDLTNTCFIRAFSAMQGTILILAEANDLEETQMKVLHAICASVKLEDE